MDDKKDNILSLLQNPEFKQWVIHPTDESNYYWENWLEHHPGNKEALLQAKEIIFRFRFSVKKLADNEIEKMLKNILSKQEQVASPNTSIFRFNPLKYAAVLVFALGMTIAFWKFSGNAVKVEESEKTFHYFNRFNPKGQRSVIRLKDGTKVHLNSNSSLIYSEDFGINNRKVVLKGEAYFTVAKDPKNLFIVTTGNVSTIAIGTEFNVDARTEDEVSIILIEGRIKVEDNKSSNTEPLILLPNQSISYNADTGFSQISNYNENDILWIQGVLKFEDTSLKKVIDMLESWYGVRIEVLGELKELHYSGEFKDVPLLNVLESMSYSLDLEYSRNNDYVQLKLINDEKDVDK